MNEVFKSFMVSIILFLLWSFFCFWLGILYNGRTDGKIDERDQHYNEQQQQLDQQIGVATGTISKINTSIREQIYISTRSTANIQELLTEIRKQKLNI